MPSTLESLPTEILQGISEILDITHPRSLVALACASKGCYAIACPFLFRTVKVATGDGKQPLQDVLDLKSRLLRDDSFAHVRRIIFYFNPERPRYPYLSLDGSEKGREDDTELWSCWDHCRVHWRLPGDYSRRAADDWDSAARLVEQLTGLTDLFWACPEQLPPCILEVLHKKAKYCRLHHYTFALSSPSQMPLNLHERHIVTSPCLYSIGNLLSQYPHSTSPPARSLQSTSLRRVYLTNDFGRVELSGKAADRPQSVPYELIQLQDGWGSDTISLDMLRRDTRGDFSALRVLKLGPKALAPRNLLPPSDFPSLVTLECTCSSDVTPHYWDELTTLLHNLPRLTSLQLWGWDRTIPITPALSPNLRKFVFSTSRAPNEPRLCDDRIYQLAEICPNLEYLDIEIKRSRGNAAEVARYRALGRLPRLQELYLAVDALPPDFVQISTDGGRTFHTDTVVEPWFDEQDAHYVRGHRPWRQGHVRDVLVNNAIDAKLARSIFEVVDGAKLRSPGRPSPLPLEHLSLYAYENGALEIYGLSHFMGAFRGDWEVDRDVRDDARDVLHVKSLGSGTKSKEQIRDLNLTKYDDLFGLWRRVWPVENEDGDWWDDWKSRPLDLALEGGETETSG